MTYPSTIEQTTPASDRFTSAARRAASNLARNLSALAETQPRLAEDVEPAPADFEFVFGRDGHLTALDRDGRWISGCSLPKRANSAILSALKVNGPISCLLAPPHAAALRVALDMTGPTHAIVTVAPAIRDLSVLLACDDFSTEIRQHRLWFAWGPRWADELGTLFEERSGLPTPSQFIRLPTSDPEVVETMIARAQRVFSMALSRRSDLAREMRDAWRPAPPLQPPRLCVLTTRQFVLWDDAAFTLGAALQAAGAGHADVVPLYLDEPLHVSPLALLAAAVECDAVVTADMSRADLADLLPRELPWFTWVTTTALPAFTASGPNDALMVADAEWRRRAVDAGWPAARVELARWPNLPRTDALAPETPAHTSAPATNEIAANESAANDPARPALAMIDDTCVLEAPASLDEFSSHRLLWNSIREEIEAEPLILAGLNPADYLDERLKRFAVSPVGLDRRLFLEGLIVPCYGQGIARLLLGAGVPLRLFGRGWGEMAEFAPHAAGPIRSRAALSQVVSRSAALVHAWPATQAHPIDAVGRLVIRPLRRRPAVLIHDAICALTSTGSGQVDSAPSGRADDELGLQNMLRRPIAPSRVPRFRAGLSKISSGR